MAYAHYEVTDEHGYWFGVRICIDGEQIWDDSIAGDAPEDCKWARDVGKVANAVALRERNATALEVLGAMYEIESRGVKPLKVLECVYDSLAERKRDPDSRFVKIVESVEEFMFLAKFDLEYREDRVSWYNVETQPKWSGVRWPLAECEVMMALEEVFENVPEIHCVEYVDEIDPLKDGPDEHRGHVSEVSLDRMARFYENWATVWRDWKYLIVNKEDFKPGRCNEVEVTSEGKLKVLGVFSDKIVSESGPTGTLVKRCAVRDLPQLVVAEKEEKDETL